MVKIFKSQLGLSSIIIVLIVVGILAVGVGIVYLYQQSKRAPQPETSIQDETANWKTYSSTKARFIFKYPPDWGIVNEFLGKAGSGKHSSLAEYFIGIAKAQSITPPEGWEIIGEGYYETPAGAKASTYTVILAPVGYQQRGNDISRPSEPIIVINERQFNCYGEEWWSSDKKTHIEFVFIDSPNFRWLPPYVKYKTLEGEEKITGTNYIATCSKDPEVLDILDEIAKSFKAIRPVNE